MERRAAAVQDTRRRIVDATVARHDLNGSIVDTSVEEIAALADVAVATLRRHFPTRDDLVSACAQRVEAELRLPSPGDAAEIFGRARSRDRRLGRVVDALCAAYARGEGRLGVTYREALWVPILASFVDYLDEGRRGLVRAALGEDATAQRVRVAVGLTAFPAWKALRDAGLGADDATAALRRAVVCATRA